MPVNNLMRFGKELIDWGGTSGNRIAKIAESIDNDVLDAMVGVAQKNKVGIYKSTPWNFDAVTPRELQAIGTKLGYKDMLKNKLYELNTKYSKSVKKMKINGEEKDFIVFNGSKTEGANKGFWAQAKDSGELYLIKFGNEAQIRSEQLASELYELGGIQSSNQIVISYTDSSMVKYEWDKPKTVYGVASKWIPINYLPTTEEASIMREGFGMDCWLANWDAMKTGNTVMSGGEAVRIDAGGALCYRARGGRKGPKFGENVGELTTFFENYSLSRPYIKDMTREELIDSLKRVTDIPTSKIIDTIDNAASRKTRNKIFNSTTGLWEYSRTVHYTPGVQNPNYLTETLLARRSYIMRFREACRDLPQMEGENIQEYIKRVDAHISKKEYKIPFDSILMSEKMEHVEKGMTMAERLSPSQKKIYEDSYNAYMIFGKNKILHPGASNILTTDSMLHSTSIANIDEILSNGITSGDLRGLIGSGTGEATQTPLCADFWDVQQTYSIKDYFLREHYNPGEVNFLPKRNGTRVSHPNSMVVVVDKRYVAPTIMNNSFMVSKGNSLLYKDYNMGGHSQYITHRAIPYGVPANAIDKIIINSKSYSPEIIAQIKRKIAYRNLDIKIYDLDGNLL